MARRGDGNELLGIWQEACGQGDDGLRRLAEHVVQRLLEEEMTVFLGAESYERTRGRRGYRNGYKPRQFKTRVGTLELMVPKDRQGRFQPEMFARYQRSEKALVLALVQMYVEGVSTRKVKRITEQLCGLQIGRSQVSELTKGLQAQVDAWRGRRLEKSYRWLLVDARQEKIRRGAEVVSEAVLLVVGIGQDGYREILGTYMADSESEATWSEVMRDLKGRGLKGVEYIVSDDHKGLVQAIGRHFQGVVWQRCQVHLLRNLLGKVSRRDRVWVLEHWREVRESATLEEARARLGDLVEALEVKYPKVAAWLEEAGEEALAVYALPASQRKRLRTTNMLERLNQELKRRTRVVRIFPNSASCLRLVTALAMETNEEWQERRYLSVEEEGWSAEPESARPAA